MWIFAFRIMDSCPPEYFRLQHVAILGNNGTLAYNGMSLYSHEIRYDLREQPFLRGAENFATPELLRTLKRGGYTNFRTALSALCDCLLSVVKSSWFVIDYFWLQRSWLFLNPRYEKFYFQDALPNVNCNSWWSVREKLNCWLLVMGNSNSW